MLHYQGLCLKNFTQDKELNDNVLIISWVLEIRSWEVGVGGI